MNRRAPLVVFLVVLLGSAAWYFTRQTDEAKITRLLEGLAKTGDIHADTNLIMRAVKVKSAIGEAFDPNARIDIPEIGGASVDTMTAGAVAAPRFMTDGQVRFQNLHITLDEPHTVAQVTGTAQLDGHRNGEARQVERPVDMQLRKVDGNWKIFTVHTGAL